MNQKETNDFLEHVLEIGRLMTQFGAEILKVEDTMIRIFKAYDIPKYEMYATTTLILVTIKTKDDIISTQSVRVGKHSHNLRGLEELNNLSRRICNSPPEINQIPIEINKVLESTKLTNYNALGYILAAGGFSIFFGGSLMDGVSGSIVGGFVYLMDRYFKVSDDNRLIVTMLMSFISGLLAILLVQMGIGHNSDKIIIGVAMLFVSTLSLVNGVKDMFYRNIVSGCFRVIESLIFGLFIAIGFGMSIALTEVML